MYTILVHGETKNILICDIDDQIKEYVLANKGTRTI